MVLLFASPSNEEEPTEVFLLPKILLHWAPEPKAVLKFPDAIKKPELVPKAVLQSPTVLL